jgi:hypothetical protein
MPAGPSRPRCKRLQIFSLLADQTVRAVTQDGLRRRDGYYNLLLSRHREHRTDAVRAARSHLDDVQKKRAGSVVSDFDVLRAQVELSNFRGRPHQKQRRDQYLAGQSHQDDGRFSGQRLRAFG